jgi:hypothetical protein
MPKGSPRYPELPIGSYELVVSNEGFQELVRPGIDLLTGQQWT